MEKDIRKLLEIKEIDAITIATPEHWHAPMAIMALQADKPPLDFEIMNSDKERYISAIHAGHAGNYSPMKQVFDDVLSYSNRQASRNEHHDNE
ncbi:hypothetical protein IH879_09290 [candidate division KSB1 bacterium]|nr:hypothetical protein [candidate division KSB1 bacterium]